MKLKKIVFGTLAGVGAVGVYTGGYTVMNSVFERSRQSQEMSNNPIEATVLEESYRPALVPRESSSYVLKVQTKEGNILAINVMDASGVPKETLDVLINKGTQISFPKGNIGHEWNETYFHPGMQTGSKYSDRIKVLNP